MSKVRYTLPELPYAYEALEPVISAEIMRLHHDIHHQAYVNGANTALDELEAARLSGNSIDITAVTRRLSFHMNGHKLHETFWQNLRPATEGNEPTGALADKLIDAFGSVAGFKTQFAQAAKAVEGSGWAALSVDSEGDLLVHQIEKHNLLGIAGYTPILVLDVWEHAYYLDYKNDRGAYVDAFWSIVNWDDVAARGENH